MKTLFLIICGFLAVSVVSAKAKGQFSFGFGFDRTWKEFDYPANYNSGERGTSSGMQLTMGGFYRQDWWLIGVCAGPGIENYFGGDRGSGSASTSFVMEITAGAAKAIAGKTLYLAGGIIPSLHMQVEGKKTMQPFVLSPYLGIILAPARHFAVEAHAGYDPFFRQARLGMSFRF